MWAHQGVIECLLIRERLRANCAVRWVTSNAQLADCLTKSMDSSSLTYCLRSGRYCLFDENRVLQERSDKRQRAKWMKEATTSIETSSPEDAHFNFGVEDTWEKNDKGQVVRPRRTRFSPIGVPGCPVDIRNLGVERATFAKFSSGETWSEKDFWPGTRGYTALDQPWTGKKKLKFRVCETSSVWLRSPVPVTAWMHIQRPLWHVGAPRGGQRWGIWAIEEKALGACSVSWLARRPLTTYTYTYTYTYTHIHIHIYIYTYTYTHIHIHKHKHKHNIYMHMYMWRIHTAG